PPGIAMQQQRHHHPRVKRRLPKPAHIAARDLLEIEALPHQFNDKPRDMAFRDEVLHIRRQKQRLIDIPGAKILAHGPRLNLTRSELNSYYSDRLLGDLVGHWHDIPSDIEPQKPHSVMVWIAGSGCGVRVRGVRSGTPTRLRRPKALRTAG